MTHPFYSDHARPMKGDLLAGRRDTNGAIEINLDHIALAITVGLLVGFLLWH